MTVDAYSHAAGVLSLTSNATVSAIAGQVITPTFTFTNSGANNDNLSIQGNSNFSAGASSGTLTAGQSASGLTAASITAPAAGGNTSKSYSVTLAGRPDGDRGHRGQPDHAGADRDG